MDEIETAPGVEIGVEYAPEIAGAPQFVAGALVGRSAPALFETETSIGPTLAETRYTIKYARDIAATLRLYSEPYAAFCHELLHLRRYIVFRVPSVEDKMCAPGVPEFTIGGLENGLEHLLIDRQLKDYGFLFPVEDCEPDTWKRFSSHSDTRTLHFRAPVLFEWLRTRYLSSNTGIQKRADSFLEKCGLHGDAWRFLDEVRPLLGKLTPPTLPTLS